MGIRIEPEAGEPIDVSLRRFRRAICAEGGFPLHHCQWHKPRPNVYTKPSTLRRRRRWIARVRKRGGPYEPEPGYWWVEDLLLRPRRCWGRIGLWVMT